MAPPPSELIGASGGRYLFKQLIQEIPHLGRVWIATCESIRPVIQRGQTS
jgi:hypothetical protein